MTSMNNFPPTFDPLILGKSSQLLALLRSNQELPDAEQNAIAAEEIVVLKDSIDSYESLLARMKHAHELRAGVVASHRRLPAEVLSLIFAASLDDHQNPFDFPDLISITEVCSRWRTIALSTPSLWNKILLDMYDSADESPDEAMHALEIWAARAGGLGIDLIIGHCQQELLQRIISSFSTRLSAIRVEDPGWHEILGHEEEPPVSLPNLHTLSLTNCNCYAISLDMPNLRSLQVENSEGVDGVWTLSSTSWAQLTSLTLDLYIPSLSPQLRTISSAAPSLEYLSLSIFDNGDKISAHDFNSSGVTPAAFLNLQSLVLGRWSGPELELFSDLPRLKILHVAPTMLGQIQWAPVTSLVARSTCRIHTLLIDVTFIETTKGDFREFLRLLSDVRKLTLLGEDKSGSQAVIRSLTYSPFIQPLLPKLFEIEFEEDNASLYKAIISLIDSRLQSLPMNEISTITKVVLCRSEDGMSSDYSDGEDSDDDSEVHFRSSAMEKAVKRWKKKGVVVRVDF